MDTNLEQIVFEIISFAGEARSFSFDALHRARDGEFGAAEDLLKSAAESLKHVHGIQTDLIQKELADGAGGTSLLMAHAQDHLMTAMLAFDLITEMVEQYKKMQSLQSK